jgi:hypothetical protein
MTEVIIFIGLFVVTGLIIVMDDGQWDRKKIINLVQAPLFKGRTEFYASTPSISTILG